MYTFNVGSVSLGACGSFIINVELDSTGSFGQTDCTEAHIYPNPFKQMTTLEVTGKDYEQLELSVFDVAGRLVKTIASTEKKRIQLTKDEMRQGVYFYQLKGDNELINTGKLVI